MAARRISVVPAEALRDGFAQIRAQAAVTVAFPAAVEAEAERAAAAAAAASGSVSTCRS